MGTFRPRVNCPYAPTTPTVHSTTISWFPCNLFPEWPLIFLVITIHQVIWPSPGTLGVTPKFQVFQKIISTHFTVERTTSTSTQNNSVPKSHLYKRWVWREQLLYIRSLIVFPKVVSTNFTVERTTSAYLQCNSIPISQQKVYFWENLFHIFAEQSSPQRSTAYAEYSKESAVRAFKTYCYI